MSVDATTGGTSDAPDPGTWVIDDDADDEERMLVLEYTDTRADEHVVYEMPDGEDDITVADYNEDYDAEESVVFVVYLSSLNHHLDDWTAEEVVRMHEDGELEDAGVRRYAFPETRLKDASE